MNQIAGSFPKPLCIDGQDFELRMMGGAHEQAVLAFAKALPTHELLFLHRDIRQPKVVAAWVREIGAGNLKTILASRGGAVVGCGTVIQDGLSWSPHVAEIRSVVAPEMRGRGLGSYIIQETFRLALLSGAEKVFAKMTTDQVDAIAVFEGLGFVPEAILRDHVRDEAGRKSDLVFLCHRVAEFAATLEAYGVGAD